MKVSRMTEMRNLDQRAMQVYGITQEILMENAGQAAYFTILKEFGIRNKYFVVFCGIGNNGGDGLVVARKILSNRGRVIVFILGSRSQFRSAAKQNYDIATKLQIEMYDAKKLSAVKDAVQNADAVVDAIFGTGLDRDVSGKYEKIINIINTSQKIVFSIDIPSGIHGDTGQVRGTAVKAHYTTTFGLPKIGSLLYPGFKWGGKLYVTHISFPPIMQNSDQLKIATNDPEPLPPRIKNNPKKSYGKVLFIDGSSNYKGAPYFAALSFLKTGGELSFLATPENVSAFFGNEGSEIVFIPQKTTPSGSLSLKNKSQLQQFSENVDMVVMGSGVSLNAETQSLVRELSTEIKKPLLIDGDGITAIASDWKNLKKRKAPLILTLHLEDLARILRRKNEDIINNKIDILQNIAQELNAVVILKEIHSLICYPDKHVFINLSGNSGMATAGSGDILTGTIAALFGLGLSVTEAVRTGVFMHGFAGDLAAKSLGEDGLIATDIMNQLPVAMKTYREDYDSIIEDSYHRIHII